MKKNILKAIAISIFAIAFVLNISINGSLNSNDTNLMQQAQATTYICGEMYTWTICCIDDECGSCHTAQGDWDGPYVLF
jgi:hypothetical protein